jgi:hypothetical protein
MTTQVNLLDKRMRDGADDHMISTTKRRKVISPEIKLTHKSQKVDPSELASAFALASLASITRGSYTDSKSQQDKEDGVHKVLSFEARSPKSENPHMSPGQRAPGSPERTDAPDTLNHMSSAPSTPEDCAISMSRKVHFAPSTKQHMPSPSPSTPHGMRSPPGSRRLLVPPRPHAHAHRQGIPMARPHPYGMNMNAFGRFPPPHQAHMLPQHMYQPRPWYRGGMYPPQSLMQPTLLHPDKQWICDFCNVAAFATYDKACVHEATCKKHCSPSQRMRSGSVEDERMGVESDTYFKGSKSLAIPETDSEWLSELNCFVRNCCVEAFSATEDDVTRTSKRAGRIALDQVGIRCKFCVDCAPKDRAVGAVSFPSSIGGIYDAVKRWQRVHLEVCEAVPQIVRTKLAALANTNVWVPTTRQYWADSAVARGLVDTQEGIRFGKSLTEVSKSTNSEATVNALHPSANMSLDAVVQAAKTVTSDEHVVFLQDREMIPTYVYFLMRQVEPCRFTESDRFVARSKGPVGYPGFQCRHCNGHAGLGKYFPVSSKSLSTNSTSQNIHAHLLKCRKCPEHVKDELIQLKIEKSKSARMEPGWRKVFFDKVWERLHG